MSSGIITANKLPWSAATNHGGVIFEDMMKSSVKGLLGGSATFSAVDGYVTLTTATPSQAGTITYMGLINLGSSFMIEFEFWSGGGTGADLVALVWGETTAYPNPLSFCLMYDEFNDRIAVYDSYCTSKTTPSFSIAQTSIDNSTWHKAKVVVGGNLNRVAIYYDDTLKLTYPNYVGNFSTRYIALQGATGGSHNIHRVRRFRIKGLDNNKPI